MKGLAPLRCPRCRQQIASSTPRYRGCPFCADEGIPVNLVCEIPRERIVSAFSGTSQSLWRFASALPVDAGASVSMGEGNTPLLEIPRLGARYGLPRMAAKNETVNPTWSHKDRLCALTVAAALLHGAKVVTAASTGNHGASLAAYAARAGLQCVIFTLASVPSTMKTLMQSYGAEVVAVTTSGARYELLTECVDRFGWYPASNSVAPPVGSDPYGVDGYKTIAYELYEQHGNALPDWLIVPTAYGDCLAGIWRGLRDLWDVGLVNRLPRLIGAERFGALNRGLEVGVPASPVEVRPTAAFSIGGAYTTWQAITAIKQSDGLAWPVSEEELLKTQADLAAAEGLYAEASSCAAIAVARGLAKEGIIGENERVVSVLTSSGLKDPETTSSMLSNVLTIEPHLDVLQHVLKERGKAGLFDPPMKKHT